MSGKFGKVMGFLGLDEDVTEDEILERNEMHEELHAANTNNANSKKGNRVVNIHTSYSAKVVVKTPKKYEDSLGVVDLLKGRKIVIVNTTEMEKRTTQRLLDFLGGASYSLEAEFRQVESGVYVLIPSNVELSGEFKGELSAAKGFMSIYQEQD